MPRGQNGGFHSSLATHCKTEGRRQHCLRHASHREPGMPYTLDTGIRSLGAPSLLQVAIAWCIAKGTTPIPGSRVCQQAAFIDQGISGRGSSVGLVSGPWSWEHQVSSPIMSRLSFGCQGFNFLRSHTARWGRTPLQRRGFNFLTFRMGPEVS